MVSLAEARRTHCSTDDSLLKGLAECVAASTTSSDAENRFARLMKRNWLNRLYQLLVMMYKKGVI